MNYIEVEAYYSTLNLVIDLFEKMDLPKYHLARIHELGELVESAYNGNLPDRFCRDRDEPISEEEFYRGILLDDFGGLLLDDSGDVIPDPAYSVLDEAKKRSILNLASNS